ncbi:hypothetical protein [Scytonema sp. NUACC26]|uniref:hypothetical protein n=1 Tax=Scytonema sp. NUACC26 TaxID=3140176 RepID=UPI0038B3BFB9
MQTVEQEFDCSANNTVKQPNLENWSVNNWTIAQGNVIPGEIVSRALTILVYLFVSEVQIIQNLHHWRNLHLSSIYK